MKITHIQPADKTTAKWQGDLMPLTMNTGSIDNPVGEGRFVGKHHTKTVEVTVPTGDAYVIVEVSKQDLIDMLAMLPQN